MSKENDFDNFDNQDNDDFDITPDTLDELETEDDFDLVDADEENGDFEYEEYTVDAEDDFSDEYTEADFDEGEEMNDGFEPDDFDDKPKGKIGRAGIIGFIILGLIIIFAVWALGTNSGRSACMGLVAKFIHSNIQTDDGPDSKANAENTEKVDEDELNAALEMDEHGNVIIFGEDGQVIEVTKDPRSEDYVRTYLIFGIESIDGAANTDAIMLISINTQDNTIKMTSILRDTYVQIPGWDKNKLNSAYAKGAHGATTGAEGRRRGAALLIRTIEETFDVKITGYASVNFENFEKIINRLGGLDIELGEKEANYLNTTNYISNPDYRNVVAGWNHLNGNQVMGYVRVRRVETLGGVNNDYGRTLRQRRVISAIIKKYKSSGLLDLLSITKDCLGYVHTNLTEDQIQEALTLIINNGIYTTQSLRIPIEGAYYDSGEKGIDNGNKKVTYTLVMEGHEEENIKALHRFVFLDPEETEAIGTDASGSATEEKNGSN